jgi:hypothetical protein
MRGVLLLLLLPFLAAPFFPPFFGFSCIQSTTQHGTA